MNRLPYLALMLSVPILLAAWVYNRSQWLSSVYLMFAAWDVYYIWQQLRIDKARDLEANRARWRAANKALEHEREDASKE